MAGPLSADDLEGALAYAHAVMLEPSAWPTNESRMAQALLDAQRELDALRVPPPMTGSGVPDAAEFSRAVDECLQCQDTPRGRALCHDHTVELGALRLSPKPPPPDGDLKWRDVPAERCDGDTLVREGDRVWRDDYWWTQANGHVRREDELWIKRHDHPVLLKRELSSLRARIAAAIAECDVIERDTSAVVKTAPGPLERLTAGAHGHAARRIRVKLEGR